MQRRTAAKWQWNSRAEKRVDRVARSSGHASRLVNHLWPAEAVTARENEDKVAISARANDVREELSGNCQSVDGEAIASVGNKGVSVAHKNEARSGREMYAAMLTGG